MNRAERRKAGVKNRVPTYNMNTQQIQTLKEDDEANVIGGEVHLDNPETMEWLEIPEKDLEEHFEPLT